MCWRDNPESTIESKSQDKGNFATHGPTSFQLLLAQIGDRDAVVDVCLPPQLAEELRRSNINAIWVPAILGDRVSDEEIEKQLLIGGGLIWQSKKQKALLTRDVRFFRKLRSRAILVRHNDIFARSKVIAQDLKKKLKFFQVGANEFH